MVEKNMQDETPEDEFDKAFGEGEEEGSEDEGKEDELPEGDEEDEEPLASDDDPEGDGLKSDKYGSLESMEKSVKDTRAHAMELQSKLNEQTAANQALQEKLKQYEEGTATKADVEKAKQDVEDAEGSFDEVRKIIEKDYPELTHLVTILDKQAKTIKGMSDELTTFKSTRAADEEAQKRADAVEAFESNVLPELKAVHKDAEEVLFSGGSPGKRKMNIDFIGWAEKQSPAMKMAALRSGDPQDLAWAITEYKKYAVSDEAKALKDKQSLKKKETIRGANSMRGGGSKPPFDKGKADPDDFDGGWEEDDD